MMPHDGGARLQRRCRSEPSAWSTLVHPNGNGTIRYTGPSSGLCLALALVVACRPAGDRSLAQAPDPCRLVPVALRASVTPVTPDTTRVHVANVTRAAVLPSNELVVLDGTGPVLFRVDTLGRTTVLHDRRGPGPGELSDPRAFAIDTRGHVWIAGPSPPAISEFDAQGRFLRSVRYWRASMINDLAVDAAGRLVAAYRLLNAPGHLAEGASFATVERLEIEGDSIRATALDSATVRTVGAAPFFNAPVVEFSLASSIGGGVVSTTTLAYRLAWYGAGDSAMVMHGCQDGVDNEERLRQSTILQGGYRLIAHDIAFAPDGSLYHLTANVRADGTQRLDRYAADGRHLQAMLIPSRRTGGAYLSGLLPTSDSTWFWGYEIGGQLYQVRVTW